MMIRIDRTTLMVLEGSQEVIILSRIMKLILSTTFAAVVVCGAVACATGPHKSEAERQANRETADRVQVALNADKLLFSRHITVNADDGVVQLGGYVWTQPELEAALRIAESVPGVTKVVDRMEVDRSGLSDSAVTR